MAATRANQLEVVQQLLISGANVNCPDTKNTYPLMAATMLGHTSVALVLIDNKANLDAIDAQGNTILHWAAATNNLEVAKELLRRGRKVSSRNNTNSKRETPIFLAVRERHHPMISLLLEHKVDITISDERGQTCTSITTDPKIKKLLEGTIPAS